MIFKELSAKCDYKFQFSKSEFGANSMGGLRDSLAFDGEILKSLFGKNGTASLGDHFCCENNHLAVLKRKEKEDLYEGTERNRCI